jgi:hypothetical protein
MCLLLFSAQCALLIMFECGSYLAPFPSFFPAAQPALYLTKAVIQFPITAGMSILDD